MRSPTLASNREKVAASRRALKALRANPANEFTNELIMDKNWYE
jgi:hypothetical protein